MEIHNKSVTKTGDKLLVLTVHTNDVQFLQLQYDLLQKNCELPFDFIVGFDKPDQSIYALGNTKTHQEFVDYTKLNHLDLIEIPSWAHKERNKLFEKSDFQKFNYLDPALRCADSVQYILGTVPWQKYKAVLFLDADMFLIRPLTAFKVNDDIPFFGVKQVRQRKNSKITYLWNGIFWINSTAPFQHLINFDLYKKHKLNTDVGGQTYKWIELLESLGTPGMYMDYFSSGTWGKEEAEIAALSTELKNWLVQDYRQEKENSFFAELYDNEFMHYRGGGNWQKRDPQIDLENRRLFRKAVLGN